MHADRPVCHFEKRKREGRAADEQREELLRDTYRGSGGGVVRRMQRASGASSSSRACHRGTHTHTYTHTHTHTTYIFCRRGRISPLRSAPAGGLKYMRLLATNTRLVCGEASHLAGLAINVMCGQIAKRYKFLVILMEANKCWKTRVWRVENSGLKGKKSHFNSLSDAELTSKILLVTR